MAICYPNEKVAEILNEFMAALPDKTGEKFNFNKYDKPLSVKIEWGVSLDHIELTIHDVLHTIPIPELTVAGRTDVWRSLIEVLERHTGFKLWGGAELRHTVVEFPVDDVCSYTIGGMILDPNKARKD